MGRFIRTIFGVMFFLLMVTSIVQAIGWDMWNPAVAIGSDRREYSVGDIITFTVHVENHDPFYTAKDIDLSFIFDDMFLEFIDPMYYNLGDLNPGEKREITVRAKAIRPEDNVRVVVRTTAINPEDGIRYANLDDTTFKIKPCDTCVPEFPGGLGIIIPVIGILIIVFKRKK